MPYYFAYGSNMSLEQMEERCPSAELVGAGLLRGYRLAFTRESKVTFPGSGVADIVEDPRLVVWGTVFRVSADDMDSLDRKEGAGKAYRRLTLDVHVWADGVDTSYTCATYEVINKAVVEIPPSPEYLAQLSSGARASGIRVGYLQFLDSLAPDATSEYRSGLRVYPTVNRSQARGQPLIKLPPNDPGAALGRHIAVIGNGRVAQADSVSDVEVSVGTCQLDQTLRHALGMPGRECYGATVTVGRLKGRTQGLPFVRPRVSVFPALAPSQLDAEKSIAILHESNIRQLGIEEGDVVQLSAAVKSGDHYSIRSCKHRVFGGSPVVVHRRGGGTDYPKVTEIYLDSDTRSELGIPEYAPVTVQADVGSLFARRLVVYGVTLFLTSLALNVYLSAALTVATAVSVTIVLIVFDLRAHIHY